MSMEHNDVISLPSQTSNQSGGSPAAAGLTDIEKSSDLVSHMFNKLMEVEKTENQSTSVLPTSGKFFI